MYKHKSVAQKRKEKQSREANSKAGSRTLFQVGVSKVVDVEVSSRSDDGRIGYLFNY